MVATEVRIQNRMDEHGHVTRFALIDCPRCGSTFTSGEWVMGLKKARDIATASLAEHKTRYPNCKRPVFA